MLTAEMNERLTRVGPGTPMGELFRRYWHPVAGISELKQKPTKRVRLLGEDLVVYRDRSGNLGLITEACPHRRCSLLYGIPEFEGLRCAYHGWMFDGEGNCIEQPAELANSTFKTRIKTPAYPVEVFGGLIWAYLGPEPKPLLPHWEYLVSPNTHRSCGFVDLPANWLQPMENSVDPVHLEWLHSYYGQFLKSNYGLDPLGNAAGGSVPPLHHAKIGFDVFEHGIIKRRIYEGGSEEDLEWKIGHAVVFPNWLHVGHPQIRVPIDDENTRIWYYNDQRFPDTVTIPQQDEIEVYEFQVYDENGEFIVDTVEGQDMMAWVMQGKIADRTQEHVGGSDRGVLLMRKLFQEQLLKMEAGEDPMCVVRDPAKNVCIKLPSEYEFHKAPTTVEEAKRQLGLYGIRYVPQHLYDELLSLTLEAYHIPAA